MELDSIFGELPYGFSSFGEIESRLLDCRARLRLPEGAKTVISVLFPYYLGEEYYENSNVSRYAVSADYHIITAKIMEEKTALLRNMFPENRFEAFVDNSPLPEVRCAVRAGLGCMGRNSLFISREYGSWVFLGEIVTDRYFEPFSGSFSLCEGCNICVEKCPAGALTGEGIIPEKCFSYLSQKKGSLSEEALKSMAENNCAWGCDICQKVCPQNCGRKVTPIKEFFETAKPYVTAADSVEGRAFAWRGPEVIARNIGAMNAKKEKNL